MLRVEMLLQEDGCLTVEERFGGQTHRVAQKGKVHVGIEVELQLSGIGSYGPCLCPELEVEGPALRLTQFATQADAVL